MTTIYLYINNEKRKVASFACKVDAWSVACYMQSCLPLNSGQRYVVVTTSFTKPYHKIELNAERGNYTFNGGQVVNNPKYL